MTTVLVGTHDLRAALTSVRPHHEKHPDFETFRRIRLEIGSENITVVATDRISAGLALVSVWETEDSTTSEAVLDLTPEQVDKILQIFKAPKDKGDDPSAILRLEVGDNFFTLTDVSGLPGIDGQSMTQPRTATDEAFPDIPHLIARSRTGELMWIEQFAANGDRLAVFRIAANVYQQPVVIEARAGTRALSITVGESFVGVLMPIAIDEDRTVEMKEWNEAWTRRLPDPAQPPRGTTKTESDEA